MRTQATSGTVPEVALRRALHRRGLRFRVQYELPEIPRRTIDIAFTARRIAVFVNGCFWHGCTEHRNMPVHNREWWLRKIEQNKARDSDTDHRLRMLGWVAVRVWEHDDPEIAAEMISRTFHDRLPKSSKKRTSPTSHE